MRPGSAIWRTIKGRAFALPFFALLLNIGQVHADPACPSGQVHQWTVERAGEPCTLGQTFASTDAYKAACLPAHGVAAGASGRHADGTWEATTSTYNGTATTFSPWINRHLSTHAATSPLEWSQVIHTCVTPPDPCPAAGTPYTGNKNLKNAFGTTGYIQESPTKVCEVVGGGGVCMSIPTGSAQGTYCPEWQYTGNNGATASDLGTVPNDSSENVCTADGRVCVSKNPDVNCGTVNGEYVCVGSPAPGGCVESASGKKICTGTPASPITTPPAPANPTNPAVPATPAASFVQPNGTGGVVNNTTTNIYNPGGASTPGGAGTPSGTPTEGEEGEGQGTCGGPGQPACEMDGDCGGVGEPTCGVKVDEAGVADQWAGIFDRLSDAESEFETERTTVSNALNAGLATTNNPGTGWDVLGFIPDLPVNTCQTISIEFFNGETKTFPPPILCDAIETWFKPTLAFFLYLFTILGIVFSGMRSATGNT